MPQAEVFQGEIVVHDALILTPRPSEFVPYRGLTTPQLMSSFLRWTGLPESSVRRGFYNSRVDHFVKFPPRPFVPTRDLKGKDIPLFVKKGAFQPYKVIRNSTDLSNYLLSLNKASVIASTEDDVRKGRTDIQLKMWAHSKDLEWCSEWDRGFSAEGC